MRQKCTDIVEGQDFHSQYRATPDEIRISKQEKAEHAKRDEKQGLSKFRVEKRAKKYTV